MKKNKAILPVLLVVFILAAVSGWGVAVYQYNEIKTRDNKIAELSDSKDSLSKQVEDLTDVENQYANYLKIDGWDVVFPYAGGVTKMKADIEKDGDDALIIKSIEKDDKVYDVNICGGEAEYKGDTFYFGKVVRWKNNGNHREGAEDPAGKTNEYIKIYQTSNYTYYYKFRNDLGCRTGSDNADYKEAYENVRDSIYSIRVKEQ